MKTVAFIGPVHFVALAYFICIIVSLSVAWFIRILFSGIKWQRHIAHAHAISQMLARKKETLEKKD
ncbi:MAG TPA: hypothetical protein P5294_00340 [Smithellaceae bacterium]|nr:hypothetical protein [Smithellaceae bacterium]HRS88310.1 hypothetical protein [Smithellaceae bacterium]HRV24955.1 hypothetical protein [Smithellaceae bacterium]